MAEHLRRKPFRIHCDAATAGALDVRADRASIAFGQEVLRNGAQQVWDFVLVLADQKDNRLTTRILLCHPDWDEPLEVASIESNGESLKVGLGQSEPRPP